MTSRPFLPLRLALLVLLPAACAAPVRAPGPADLLDALRPYCGKAFAGRVVVDTPPPAASPFAGKDLVMHVRECRDAEIRVPFHVGADRSRTWVLTRTASGVRLKHDHRHEDGTSDKVTLYGGDSGATRGLPGSGVRMEFPVDAASVANFEANGLTASVRNTWAMELVPGRFVYELSRPDGRLFRVEFDLARPVPPPPPPWGTMP